MIFTTSIIYFKMQQIYSKLNDKKKDEEIDKLPEFDFLKKES